MCTSSQAACLPVAFMSPKSPFIVPEAVTYWTSVSPSAISWFTVYFRSGNAVLTATMKALSPSRSARSQGIAALDVPLADHLVDHVELAFIQRLKRDAAKVSLSTCDIGSSSFDPVA